MSAQLDPTATAKHLEEHVDDYSKLVDHLAGEHNIASMEFINACDRQDVEWLAETHNRIHSAPAMHA